MLRVILGCKTLCTYRVLARNLCYEKLYGKLSIYTDDVTHNQRCYVSMFSKQLTHSDRKCILVPIEVMYAVVADVDSYKQFIPWCTKSVITSRTNKTAKAQLAVGFGPIQEKYNSTLVFNEPRYVKSVCTDGKLFNLLDCTWRFTPGKSPSTCIIHFDVVFEFRSLMYTKLANMFFNEVVKKMVSAFESRALVHHKQQLLLKKRNSS